MELLNLILEVPTTTDKGGLEAFLKKFSFAVKSDNPIPLGNKIIYIIEGPKSEYGKFEDAVKQEKGYMIWSNPVFEPFGLPTK